MPEKIYVGDSESLFNDKKVEGKQLKIANENFYKISNVDKMRPFFMSIVSNSNHWMFISSTGSLSAGRKNSEFALFPYYTDDKITESSETTGSKTILVIKIANKNYLWPEIKDKYLQSNQCKIVIQINGKKRGLILMEKNIKESDLIEEVKKTKELQRFIEEKIIIKTIFIKDKLINLILK